MENRQKSREGLQLAQHCQIQRCQEKDVCLSCINVEKLYILYCEATKGVYGKMDINGWNGFGGFGGAMAPHNGMLADGGLPAGFGMALAMNEAAMAGYAGLTEAEKEKVILRCKDVKTKSQMQEIVDSLVPGEDIQGVYEEEKESFS